MISLSLYALQELNGVIESLKERLSGGADAVTGTIDLTAREDIELRFMTRSRYPWILKCEESSQTSSKEFARALSEIKAYFYDSATLRSFSDMSLDHSHEADFPAEYNHDDFHQVDRFHMHLKHSPPEHSFVSIQLLQSFVLIYYLIVLVIFILAVYATPPLDPQLPSKSELFWLRCKNLTSWTLILIVVALFDFYSAWLVFDSILYS